MVETFKELKHTSTFTFYLEDYDSRVVLSDRRDPKVNSNYLGPLGFGVVVENVSPIEFYSEKFLSGLFETISERITGYLLLETQSRLGENTPESATEILFLPKYGVKEYGYSSEERKIFANFAKSQRKVEDRVNSG